MAEIKSTCPYCGVGCGVIIETTGDRISGVRGDPDHPANFGRLCGKGQTLHLTVEGHGRALHPEIRRERSAERTRAGWDEALDLVAHRFADIIKRDGPDAVAFYISGQLLTEDYYVFNKFARALVGTNNIDSNSRLCMSSAVAGYKATLGADAPPGCYEDIDHTDCLLIAGSNAAWAHPVLFRRIEEAKANNPDLKIIVIDPRRTATAEIADLHLAIQPGSDVALFLGMLNVLLWEGLINQDFVAAHTEGFDAAKSTARDMTPEQAARICGVSAGDIVTAATWFGRAKAAMSMYCMGLNQSSCGTEKNAALIHLHLATGQLGRPGAGPFSLTGQPNAMGGREIGAMANLLIGHRDLSNPAHREAVARLWQVPSLSATPGKTAVDMFDAIRRGEIKAVWIACTNPAQSMPDLNAVHEALQQAEFVVLQETYSHTDTAPYADVLLPAAGWGEKEGTVTNSERRISRVRAGVAAPGEAQPDWRIAAETARRLANHLGHSPNLFAFESAEAVHREYRLLTTGCNTDISGLDYARLDAEGPLQWPVRPGEKATSRLYTNGRFPTASGRARFMPLQYKAVAEEIDARYPFRLTTGRLRDQWHGMTRTGRVPQLWGHVPEPAIALHPDDLVRRGLKAGDILKVESRRGMLTMIAEADPGLAPGTVFLPMHWGGRYLNSVGCNAVTLPVTDARSCQPELKHAAVRLSPLALPWRLIAFGNAPDSDSLALLDRLQGVLKDAAFATAVPVADGGVLLRMALPQAPAPALTDRIHALFGLNTETALRYSDPRRHLSRCVRLDGDRIAAACLSGDTTGESWLREFFAQGISVADLGARLLAPVDEAPRKVSGKGRVVCSCYSVGEQQVADALASVEGSAGERLAAVQSRLRCGTQCGSCLPELRRLATSVAKQKALAA